MCVYSNLNGKYIDNKHFSKTVKASLSDKVIATDKMNLSEKGEIVKN